MQIQQIPFKDLSIAEENARSKKAVNGVDTLTASIHALGLLCPLVAVQDDGIKVIAGQRRLAAITNIRKNDKKAFDTVPVYVIEGLTSEQAIEMSLHENIERELLNPIDEADAFQKMVHQDQDIIDIAINFGRTERFVNQRLRIADLPIWVKWAVVEKTITIGVAQIMTSASKAQMTTLATSFNENPGIHIFQSVDAMARAISENSRITVGAALFDVKKSGLHVTRNLFDEGFDGIITDVEAFWPLQYVAMKLKAEEFEAEGHAVHIFGRDEPYPRHKYKPSKAKKHTVVIDARHDGSVEITSGLKLTAEAEAFAADLPEAETTEPETKTDLSKKLMLEMNELRSMSVAHAIAMGNATGFITQAANVMMMFGGNFSSNGGKGHPYHWSEDLAAEHSGFGQLEEAASAICTILNIEVPEGIWALNAIANPAINSKWDEVIYSVLNMEQEHAIKLQGILVASHAVLASDTWAENDSINIVEVIGASLNDEEEDGFSANQDWELNERTIDSIRNRNALEHLLMLCGESSSDGFIAGYDSKTKISDLKKLLINYTASNSGRKAPWLSWLDFPAKELG